MKPEHMRAAWRQWANFESVQVGEATTPDELRELIERIGESSQRVAEGLTPLRESVGLDRETVGAFYAGEDENAGGGNLLSEPEARAFRVGHAKGAMLGLIVGLLAAREAGEYLPIE